jgi:hypothetical protein
MRATGGDERNRPRDVSFNLAEFYHNGLPLGCSPQQVQLQSRHAAPPVLSPWLDDRRRLDVMVRRIRIRGGASYRDLAMDDPGPIDG